MSTRKLVASDRFAADPYSYYEEWRKRGNVIRLDREDIWILTGYDEAVAALKNARV